MIIIKTRSEVKVTVTRKWYATLRHPKMYPHTKFGIPNSKNIGDMDRTRKRDGRTDGLTDGLTDRRTVRLLYASQSSFGGIKMSMIKKYYIHKLQTSPQLCEEELQNIYSNKTSIHKIHPEDQRLASQSLANDDKW